MADAFLAADIGGTYARLAIVKGSKVAFQERPETKSITDLSRTIEAFLAKAKRKGHSPKAASIAVAGPIEERDGRVIATMTNAAFTIDQRLLERRLKLPVLLINDFEAAAYAATVVKGKIVKSGRPVPNRTIAVVGAGTGLGKALLVYDKAAGYRAVASEGGHADLPLSQDEQSLAGILSQDGRPVYEDALSGRGLERLYHYLRLTRFRETQLPIRIDAAEISLSKAENPCSAATMELFAKLYGRCCRNFALETAAWGGLVIAGGVAAKNPELLGRRFLEELERHPNPRYAALLKRVPVTLLDHPDAGLLGAAAALQSKRTIGRRR